ncbi:2-C-methyl-D-erythritol 4-phosphate cytidylyltransferase [Streptomyces californicus]
MSVPHEAKPRTTAVVLAGGTGQRVGLSIPKQLLKIAGNAVIEHTLTIFENAEGIDDVIVLMAPGFVPDVEKIVAKAGLPRSRATSRPTPPATRPPTRRRSPRR